MQEESLSPYEKAVQQQKETTDALSKLTKDVNELTKNNSKLTKDVNELTKNNSKLTKDVSELTQENQCIRHGLETMAGEVEASNDLQNSVIDQASAGLINHAGKRDLIEKLEPGISKQDLDRRCDRTFAGTLAGYAQNRAKELQPWSKVEREFMLKNSSDQVIGKGSTILHDARNIGEGAQVKLAEGLERSCSGNDLRAGKALYCKIYGGDDFDDEVAAKKASLKDCGKKGHRSRGALGGFGRVCTTDLQRKSALHRIS